MKWWYANEESDLKERAGKWIDYINCEVIKEVVETIKESKMEFDKSRVYTALNADELKAGDKVIVANDLMMLRERVQKTERIWTIVDINPDDVEYRFKTEDRSDALAYLVERAENCTNCDASPCGYRANHDIEDNKINKCPLWFQQKTEPRAEKKSYEYDVPIMGQINEDGVIEERQVGVCHCKFKALTKEAEKAYECAMTNACPNKHYRPFADLRIGQEVYIRANVNEIRKDYIICENAGGYFGTVREEIRCGVEE